MYRMILETVFNISLRITSRGQATTKTSRLQLQISSRHAGQVDHQDSRTDARTGLNS